MGLSFVDFPVVFPAAMIPQAHLIGNDFSVYYDLAALVMFLCLCMVGCYIWLARQKRSFKFLTTVWVGFFFLLSLGTIGLTLSIYEQRLSWRNFCSKLVASYADVISKLEHEKIRPGNPSVFSDWSVPFTLSPPAARPPTAQSPTVQSDTSPQVMNIVPAPPSAAPHEKLAAPQGFVGDWQDLKQESDKPFQLLRRNQWAVAALTNDSEAFGHCTKQIVLRWEPVPLATVYRLEWQQTHQTANQWFAAYIGSQPFCTLIVPGDMSLRMRVRAEDGTPEDDPYFNHLARILDFPASTCEYVGYIYTLRYMDDDRLQFVVAPISDANHNGFIDVQEVPSGIGEFYPSNPLSQYIAQHRERAMYFAPITDKWGQWFTIAEPMWSPDNKMEGVCAMDFRVDVVHHQMFLERIYPLCTFALIIFFYFGVLAFVCRLQIRAETISQLAEELQDTISKLTEVQLVTEKALQVKTAFLANMSHEIRTPLNVMLGFTEIISQRLRHCADSEHGVCTEAIKNMREHGKNLLDLMDNVLNVAAMDATQFTQLRLTPVHIRNQIDEIADSMQSRAEHKSLKLIVNENQNVPEWILSDTAHIQQVLRHLIDNAIKFTTRGTVSVDYGVTPPSPAEGDELSDPLDTFLLFIAVSDTGIGIAADQLEKIFGPFSQTDSSLTRQYGGTGIGLSVAKHSAEMLNGRITVASQLGSGSTFTFTFPAKIAEPTPEDQASFEKSQIISAVKVSAAPAASTDASLSTIRVLPLSGCTVLYVEDIKVNQVVLARQIEKAGASLELADNGRIGIDKIAAATAQGKPFDIILMDMQMPVLDGYEATRHLRSHGYNKPIIAVTAHFLPDDQKKALEAGCDVCITKPVDFARLIAVMKTLWKQ